MTKIPKDSYLYNTFLNTFEEGKRYAVNTIDEIISNRHDKAVLDGKQEVAQAMKELLDQVRTL